LDLDPHWFAYPSLTVYLQFTVQGAYFLLAGFRSAADFVLSIGADPSVAVILGRLVSVAADAVTIVFAGRIARRYGTWAAALAMLLVALAPAAIRTARLIYADNVMTAFALAALDSLLAYRERGDMRKLAMAAALTGAAIGSKYPAVVLLVPLIVATFQREPAHQAQRLVLGALAVVAVTFLLTTPYLITSWSEVARDVVYMGDTTTRGGLGKLGGPALWFSVSTLGANLGWLCLALALVSLWRARGGADASTGLLWVAWSVVFIPVAAVPVLAERYLLPAIALGACLTAAGAAAILERFSPARSRVIELLVVVLCLAQPAWAGIAAARTGRTTTQLEAKRWCETHVPEGALILSEAYGPSLPSRSQRSAMVADPLFNAASAQARAAYLSRRAFHLVWMPLLVGGYAAVRMPTPDARELTVFSHAVDWNAAAYDVRLLRGVDYVVTTGAVRGRFDADPVRFVEQRQFYSTLDSIGDRTFQVAPDRDVEGSPIVIYRLSTGAQAALARLGSVDTLWWARTVPDAYKAQADRILRAALSTSEWIPWTPLWVQSLRPAYLLRYGAFADELAANLSALLRFPEAAALARASLYVAPKNINAVSLLVEASRGSGSWQGVPQVLERSMITMVREGEIPPDIQLGYAESLCRTGDLDRGRRLLERLSEGDDPRIAREAHRLLAEANSSAEAPRER
jgi:hypothetical protein